jgi:hypothetical protein
VDVIHSETKEKTGTLTIVINYKSGSNRKRRNLREKRILITQVKSTTKAYKFIVKAGDDPEVEDEIIKAPKGNFS